MRCEERFGLFLKKVRHVVCMNEDVVKNNLASRVYLSPLQPIKEDHISLDRGPDVAGVMRLHLFFHMNGVGLSKKQNLIQGVIRDLENMLIFVEKARFFLRECSYKNTKSEDVYLFDIIFSAS